MLNYCRKFLPRLEKLLDHNANGALRAGGDEHGTGQEHVTEKITQNGKKSNFSMASILGEDSDGSKTISMDSSESDSEQIVPTAARMSPDALMTRPTGYCEPEAFQSLINPGPNIGRPHMVPAYPPISMWGFFGGHTAQQNQNNFATTKSKRNRTIFTQKQIERLEIEFGKSQYMIGTDRVELAKELNLSETQVSLYFSILSEKFQINPDWLLPIVSGNNHRIIE